MPATVTAPPAAVEPLQYEVRYLRTYVGNAVHQTKEAQTWAAGRCPEFADELEQIRLQLENLHARVAAKVKSSPQ